MDRFLRGLVIFCLVLVAGLIFSSVKGIFWPDNDIILVTSNTDEGVKFSNENTVRFIPNRVIGTFWTDFYISKSGKYIFDYKEDFANDTFTYRLLEDKYIKHFQLHTKYSWWQSYGLLVILGSGIILSFFGEDLFHLIFEILSEV